MFSTVSRMWIQCWSSSAGAATCVMWRRCWWCWWCGCDDVRRLTTCVGGSCDVDGVGDVAVMMSGVWAPVCSGAGSTCDRISRDRQSLTATASWLPDNDTSRGSVGNHGRTAALSQLSYWRQTVGCKQLDARRLMSPRMLYIQRWTGSYPTVHGVSEFTVVTWHIIGFVRLRWSRDVKKFALLFG